MTRFATLQEIQTKIWDGEYRGPDGAVALHKYRYHKTPKGRRRDREMICYAVTLYSARRVMNVVPLYKPLLKKLINQIAPLAREGNADALDVLSTHLLWVSGLTHGVSIPDTCEAGIAAGEAAALGLEVSEGEERGGHTRALLLLTYADICVRNGGKAHSVQYLIEAAFRARHIKDANQKARVYRKLAYLWGRQHWNPFLAAYFLVKCRQVQGVSADVIAKNDPRVTAQHGANV